MPTFDDTLPGAPPIATLLAISGPLTGMRLELADETRVGRSEENDLVLPDALVSRLHALIRRRNLSWIVEDLDSRHGTFLNRRRIEGSRPLLRNDELQIGQSRFLFDSEVDVQNADFSDRLVYLGTPTDETLEVAPVAVLAGTREEEPGRDEGLEFVVQLGELFDSANVALPDALNGMGARLASLFRADALVLFLRDSVTNDLRPSVALYPGGETLADRSIVQRVSRERKSLLVSDHPDLARHPSPDAPAPPSARSVLCAPLEAGEALIGVVYLQRSELDSYSLLDLRNLRAVARLMAVFIEARQKAVALEMRARFDDQGNGGLICESAALRSVMDMVRRVAPAPVSVLITGETGTGKEVIAREVHRLSAPGMRGGEFVAVNCSAIPETLFESQLFGHEKGAFTGAVKLQQGLIERANGGTLFLDEVGELSPAVQPKLLRFLQERVFTRVGGTRCLRADVRLICATNRNLEEDVKAGLFREDLFHRLSVMPLHLPPLRERRDDIVPLAQHFLALHARSIGRPIRGFGKDALEAMMRYEWPGNIRELSNGIERAVLLCDGEVILARHLVFQGRGERTAAPGPARTDENDTPLISLADLEARHIQRVLDACEGNQMRASEVLGIHRNTLRKKIQDYGIR